MFHQHVPFSFAGYTLDVQCEHNYHIIYGVGVFRQPFVARLCLKFQKLRGYCFLHIK